VSSTTATSSEIPGAQSSLLHGLVNYQEGSVVSRVILKRDQGNVTIFAFDEGQGLSEHTSPFDALVQAVEGEAEITIAGKAVTMRAGEVVLLPATQRHAVKASTRFKMLLTMIRS
jgi:quercetin dioxygenase-like cupin family protein